MKKVATVIMTVLLFTACNISGQKNNNISADDFEAKIKSGGVQLVDVRTPEEFASKRIAGAQNINVNGSEFETAMNKLDKNKPLYIYCLSGGRSGNAAAWASKNGFKEVYNLEGGIMNWMNKGKAVEAEGNAAKGAMTQDDYLKAVNKEKLVLVDFNAVWCGPCKVLKPRVKKVVKDKSEQVEMLDIDVDKNPAVANYMNVQAIPLLILYKQGKEVWRKMGVAEEQEITDAITKAL